MCVLLPSSLALLSSFSTRKRPNSGKSCFGAIENVFVIQGGWGAAHQVRDAVGMVQRVLENERLKLDAALSLSPGQSFRAPSCLPTSPDAA